eukprot:4635897-Amphidinium_carterae.1
MGGASCVQYLPHFHCMFVLCRKNAWKLAMIPGTAAIFILRGYRMWRDESNKKKEKQEKDRRR